ncbi:histidine permease YuiF [Helicobacter mustelae]|nr:histidine permease YuiF [Helicobacter mustelae]
MIALLTNPMAVAIFIMMVLCLLRFNVFLSIVVAALVGGLMSHMNILETLKLMIHGMNGNMETALSYVFLGILAVAVSRGNLTKILVYKVMLLVQKKRPFLFSLLPLSPVFPKTSSPFTLPSFPSLSLPCFP